jgi:hypothetical protein
LAEEEARGPGQPPAGEPEAQQPAGKQPESLFFRIQKMRVSERIALALKGDKEARALLIKDANKLVQLAVIGSPRISDPEVAAISKNRSVHDEVLRRIAASKAWLKKYEIRLNLVQNAKTPLPISMKLLITLNDKDLAALAKSKNVPTAIAALARKSIQPKK